MEGVAIVCFTADRLDIAFCMASSKLKTGRRLFGALPGESIIFKIQNISRACRDTVVASSNWRLHLQSCNLQGSGGPTSLWPVRQCVRVVLPSRHVIRHPERPRPPSPSHVRLRVRGWFMLADWHWQPRAERLFPNTNRGSETAWVTVSFKFKLVFIPFVQILRSVPGSGPGDQR